MTMTKKSIFAIALCGLLFASCTLDTTVTDKPVSKPEKSGDATPSVKETVLPTSQTLPYTLGGWGDAIYIGSDGGAELTAAGAKKGDKIRVYASSTSADWEIEFWGGHWDATYARAAGYFHDGRDFEDIFNLSVLGYCEFTLTQEALDNAAVVNYWGGSFLIQGDPNGDGAITVSKIVLVQ